MGLWRVQLWNLFSRRTLTVGLRWTRYESSLSLSLSLSFTQFSLRQEASWNRLFLSIHSARSICKFNSQELLDGHLFEFDFLAVHSAHCFSLRQSIVHDQSPEAIVRIPGAAWSEINSAVRILPWTFCCQSDKTSKHLLFDAQSSTSTVNLEENVPEFEDTTRNLSKSLEEEVRKQKAK